MEKNFVLSKENELAKEQTEIIKKERIKNE